MISIKSNNYEPNKTMYTMKHQPTFDERIEDIQSSINILRDILESRRFSGRETSSVIDDIGELEKEKAGVEKERLQYLKNVI